MIAVNALLYVFQQIVKKLEIVFRSKHWSQHFSGFKKVPQIGP
jgi:hypothetical protein